MKNKSKDSSILEIVNKIRMLNKNEFVEFESLGKFLFSLTIYSNIDREFIVSQLEKMFANKKSDKIRIHRIEKNSCLSQLPTSNLRFLLTYGYKCTSCETQVIEEINLGGDKEYSLCELCREKAYEYQMDEYGEENTL